MGFAKLPTWAKILIILLMLIILLLLIFWWRCCHRRIYPAKSYQTGMVIWKKPETPDSLFQQWLLRFKDSIRVYGEITDSAVCPTCDSTLFMLSGPAVLLFEMQQVAGGSGGQGTGGTGDDGPAYYCSNVDLGIPEQTNFTAFAVVPDDSAMYLSKALVPKPPYFRHGTPGTVTVAVFDTGLDGLDSTNFVAPGPSGCIADTVSRYGWNFVANNGNTIDDSYTQHGSKVSRLMMAQAGLYGNPNVSILPVKVLDSTGTGNLFNLLCGMAYAAKAGAKIFNTSLGFYFYPDTSQKSSAIGLLKHYVHHYLRHYNIILVTAAGNQIPHQDTTFMMTEGHQTQNPRNLELNPFYPAALTDSADSSFIFTVTTVSIDSSKVSPLQNFSAHLVDVGVNCDAVIDTTVSGKIMEEYVFADPRQFTQFTRITQATSHLIDSIPTVTGSSFATPIIAGRIAANYSYLVTTGGHINKSTIIGSMLNPSTVPPTSSSNLTGASNSQQPPDPLLSSKPAFDTTIRKGITGCKVKIP